MNTPRSPAMRALPMALLCALAWCWGSCGEESDTSSGQKKESGTVDGGTDTAVVDANAEDTAAFDAEPVDIAIDDTGALDGGPGDTAKDAVTLPKPATAPTDLPPGVVATHLSSKPYDSVGKSENLQVELPDKAISLLAVIRGDHPGRFLFSKAVTMMGTVWMKGECTELCTTCDNRVQATAATGAGLIPSSTASLNAIKTMTWHLGSCGYAYKQKGNTFAKAAYSGKPVQTVIFSRASADGSVPTSGTLRLRLIFTGAAGVSADTSGSDGRTKAMLGQAAKILQTAGVALEVADRRDIGPGFEAVGEANDLSLSGSSGLDNLFAEAAAFGGSALLDVFIVGKIGKSDAPGGELQGISGGVPGPAFYHGIPRAGVAVALGAFGDKEGDLAGRVLARQIGHFLGLWWTSTPDGSQHDPIDDTAQCSKSSDGDGDGLLSDIECVGKGSDNAMFWQGGTPEATFSKQQGRILRAHPLVFGPG